MPAQSKQQQKFMGMVHALKKGEMDPADASPEVKKAAQSMSDKDAKDFASTSHKGLPRKVKQEIVNKLKEYANKMGTNTMGGDDYTSSKRGGLRDFDGYDNVDYNKDMPMDENVSPQVLKVLNLGLKKINRKFKGASLDGKTIDIELHPGHNRDSEIYQIYDLLKKLKLDKHKTSIFNESVNEGMFSTIDHIRQNSKSVRDFIKNVLSDKQFRDMKSDKDFIKYLGSIYEGKLPNNWMQGRTSDYHTKLGTTPRDKYDDTNFKKDNSGQPDLEDEQNEGASDVNKAVIPSDIKIKLQRALDVLDGKKLTYPQKLQVLGRVLDSMGIDKGELNKVSQRLRSKLESIEEGDLEDAIHQVKKFDKPKDGKLLTIKVINKLKDKRNKSNSSSNKQKLQQMIDKIEGDYKKGKFLTEAPIFNTLNNPRFKKATSDLVKNKKVKNPETGKDVQVTTALKDKDHPAHNQAKSFFQRLKSKLVGEYASNQTLSYLPADEEEIEKMNETMIRRAVDIAQELLPKDTWARFSSDGKKNAEFVKNVVRDLTQSLNKFYKNHDISVRIKENEEDSNVDMVLGVLSILRQIDDKENRKRVAVDMIKKFKEQDIDFDYQEFIDLIFNTNRVRYDI